jgi:hypothetical protein
MEEKNMTAYRAAEPLHIMVNQAALEKEPVSFHMQAVPQRK